IVQSDFDFISKNIFANCCYFQIIGIKYSHTNKQGVKCYDFLHLTTQGEALKIKGVLFTLR
ncbi:hypothetical protein BU666_02340, partial [Staphylococcus chromogenes]